METYARSIKICAWCKTKGYYAMKKGGRYLWVFAAISIVTLVPLIFEVEREVQTLELEELDLQGSKLLLGGVMALVAALPTTNIRVLGCARPIHTAVSPR